MKSSTCHQRSRVSVCNLTHCPLEVHNGVDIPYEPPFEMPNYREVGKTLMALIRSYTLDDDPPSNDITFTVGASENNFFAPPALSQQEIGECPLMDVVTFIQCLLDHDVQRTTVLLRGLNRNQKSNPNFRLA